MMNKMDNMVIGIRYGITNHDFKKDKGVNALIVEVAIIVIAIALLLFFKDQIASVIKDFISEVKTSITAMFTKAA